MRVVLTALVLCLYFVLYFYYIYEWTNYDTLNNHQCRLFWQVITFGLLTFAFIDKEIGMVYNTHKQLNKVCFLSVIFNLLVNILAMTFVIKHPELLFYLFNGFCFAITCIILFSAKKHDFLSD